MHRWIAVRTLAGAITVTTGAVALGVAAHPAAAASALATIESAVTCAATGSGACVSGTDTSSGSGVSGTSSSGSGVRGTSKSGDGLAGTSTSSYGIFGASSTGGAGVSGLYVAAKSARGFIVREAQGGRSTIAFDYRIVATALGGAGQRMSTTTNASMPRGDAPVVARPKPPLSVPVLPVQ
jgi:hypothetical protein